MFFRACFLNECTERAAGEANFWAQHQKKKSSGLGSDRRCSALDPSVPLLPFMQLSLVGNSSRLHSLQESFPLSRVLQRPVPQ